MFATLSSMMNINKEKDSKDEISPPVNGVYRRAKDNQPKNQR